MREIDFSLYVNKNQSRTFGFTNDDDTVYNMTGSTVRLYLYITSTPITIVGSITLLMGIVLINFLASDLLIAGKYEYIVEETKADLSTIPLTKGNITLQVYIPFSDSIDAYLNAELPADVTLTDDYKNQRITYWRRFLMSAFYVAEANINIDSSWTSMQNAFIAKLVAHDSLLLAARGSLMHIFGGATTTTSISTSEGGIKRIVTGPSEVEFFPVGDVLKNVFTTGANGNVMDILMSDICGLANFLRVKVPMCKANKIPVLPRFYTNEEFKLHSEERTVESQGDITI